MVLARIDISLTLVSPFLTGGDSGPAFGLDVVLPRSVETNRVIVPGTLLRGNVRDALLSLCVRGGGCVPGDADLTIDVVEDLFGRASGARGAKDGKTVTPESELPERGCLAFGDLEAETTGVRDGSLTRIQIDDALGTVKEGHLQVLEMPWPIGELVTFKGTVVVSPGGDATLVEKALRRSLAVIPALGAAKSAGFGAIRAHEVVLRPAVERTHTAVAASPIGRYRATLDFDGPFLVTADKVAPNVFSGSVSVPGGVIKGAVANILGVNGSDTAFGKFLSRTVFGEARPELPGQARSMTPPFSLCVYRNGRSGRLDDALFEETPSPQGAAGVQNVVGTFGVDWKEADCDAVDRAFPGLAARPTIRSVAMALGRVVRTRTKIDHSTGTADQGDEGEGGGLFVYDMVSPHRNGEKISWTFDITLEDEADAKHLTSLVDLDIFIGKLPTVARISKIEPVEQHTSQQPKFASRVRGIKGPVANAWAIHLETPALLTPIDELRELSGDISTVYRNSFSRIFGCEINLLRFYARQRLVGGWQALRYPSRPDRYEPWILTEAGSVFLLLPPSDRQSEFQSALGRFVACGLPEQGIGDGESWRTCPFPRVNGYGEISLWSPGLFSKPFN